MFSFRALGRHVGAASLASIVAGVLVAGVLGRIAMRVSGAMSRPDLVGGATSNGNRVGEVTFAGTVEIAIFAGLGAGIAGAALFASAEPWLRRVRPWNGVAFGLALLLALGSVVIEPGNFDFQRFGSAPVNIAMFAGLFVAFGALTAWLFDRIRGALEGAGRSVSALEFVAFVSAVGVTALSALFFASISGLDSPIPALMFAVIAIVPAVVRWRGLPPVIAYAAFAIPFAVGAWRTLTGISLMLG